MGASDAKLADVLIVDRCPIPVTEPVQFPTNNTLQGDFKPTSLSHLLTKQAIKKLKKWVKTQMVFAASCRSQGLEAIRPNNNTLVLSEQDWQPEAFGIYWDLRTGCLKG